MPYNIINMNKNLNVITYNLDKMKIQELKFLRKILKINYLDNIEALKQLRDYYISQKSKKIINPKEFFKDIITLYIIPITFGIINIYTALNMNTSTESSIINIAYIIFVAMVISSIILIVYLISEIKKFSSTNYYTIPKIERLILEEILSKMSRKEKTNVQKKRCIKRTNEKIQIKRRK